MTISPPSNVRLSPDEPARALASGIDSLRLAIDVVWEDERFLDKLAELKAAAVADEDSAPGRIKLPDDSGVWLFAVRPHGADGYAYLLNACEMDWTVGNWAEPKSRPSVMVTIRSETLWTHGPAAVIERVRALIAAVGGRIVELKVSRVDLCVDVLLRASDWNRELLEHVVSRAEHRAPYYSYRTRTGLQVGKGSIVARLYNKPLEIIAKSNKVWMYDIWGLDRVPKDHVIIRVEYQFKREACRELGVNSFADLESIGAGLWRYATENWLKLAIDVSKHTARQKLLPWWPIVQQGYAGAQAAEPAIRAKAVAATEEQLASQIVGLVTSLVALLRQGELLAPNEVLDMQSHLGMVLAVLRRTGIDDREFTERVKRKQAKYQRHDENFKAAVRARAAAGVSFKGQPNSGKRP